ncbi:hypothetical protein ACIBJF_39465 [Streptomyces sp. NPDC050743]|uniref:hypothetical protein n=1 Tax=Streptomyces sp. NPDC050743 TaxID=3365634 RepID=UPI0037902402
MARDSLQRPERPDRPEHAQGPERSDDEFLSPIAPTVATGPTTPSPSAAPTALDPRRIGHLLDAVVALSADLSPRAALQQIVDAATGLVGARYGALGVMGESRRPCVPSSRYRPAERVVR